MSNIKKSELNKLIKEEVMKVRRIQELTDKKEAIKKQLSEIYLGEEEGEIDEIFGFSAGEKEKKFVDGARQLIAAWKPKGYRLRDGNQWDEIVAAAKADGFQGSLGVDQKTKFFRYRPSSEMKFSSGFGGGGQNGVSSVQ
jgi:hypothetical protein